MTMVSRMCMRWMTQSDLSSVLEIENQSFDCPWNKGDFLQVLRQRNCIGIVAEWEDEVVGYLIYELCKNRIHILNLAVSSRHRRCGVATKMVGKLTSKLTATRRDRIVTEVRETNLAAQLFFKSSGFRAISTLRDFYEDTAEDAYVFQFLYGAGSKRCGRWF